MGRPHVLGVPLMRMVGLTIQKRSCSERLRLAETTLLCRIIMLVELYWGKGQYRRAANELEKYLNSLPMARMPNLAHGH